MGEDRKKARRNDMQGRSRRGREKDGIVQLYSYSKKPRALPMPANMKQACW